MYERILLPTDGSTGTAHVALQAIDLAEQYGATIHGLHVVDTDTTSLLSDIGTNDRVLERRGEQAVSAVEKMAESHDVVVETAVIEGDPAESILEYADEIGADIIVAGTHGRSGVKRHLLGSVAERLVRHADCPVLTVQLPETDVTVEREEHARELAVEALESEGYDADILDIERQLNVWVIEGKADGDSVLVYLDPKTQRTSIISYGQTKD